MVTGGNVDRDRVEVCKGLPKERSGIMGSAFVLVEVSAAEKCVSPKVLRKAGDGTEYITEGLSPLAGGLADSPTPSKRGVKM